MSDQEQKGIYVKQQKRLAMGEKLTGASMQPKGSDNKSNKSKGGLSHVKKQK